MSDAKWVVCLVLALVSVCFADERPTTQPATRLSADHLPLPAIGARTIDVSVPFVADQLGKAPEEISKRVYGALKSKDFITRSVPGQLGCDWYAAGLDGSEMAALNLTDGRTTSIGLFSHGSLSYPAIRKQIAATSIDHQVQLYQCGQDFWAAFAAAPNTSPLGSQSMGVKIWALFQNKISQRPIGIVFDFSKPNLVVISIHPMDIYILSHDVSNDDADAMHKGTITKGMKLEQVMAVLGEPESNGMHRQLRELRWSEYKPVFDDQPQPQVMSLMEYAEGSHYGGVAVPRKVRTRSIFVGLTDDVVTDYTDEKN